MVQQYYLIIKLDIHLKSGSSMPLLQIVYGMTLSRNMTMGYTKLLLPSIWLLTEAGAYLAAVATMSVLYMY